ncbi:TIGR03089 family protein [Streptomyces spiramenti]|uniref:TIGR03089 family protein n=1 Tax=Streptomyces spiramenti TaxID=2720606 RepID=A0ABX1AWH6_9ACTN|nr:TIGR03089 family protein [Streptomyces spiramenti]NJP68732.1 TIGR03089 family protein [Streptomyces spiramenti]
MNTSDQTPYDLLRSALATDGARPLVTYYDDTTGERVELSAVTLANWVAKTAGLLQDELGAEPGDRLALLLPAHWQTAAWLLACSATGVAVEIGGDPAAADLVVTGPDRLAEARACTGERVALSLRPLGLRFPQAPEGFIDYAVAVPGQPDTFQSFEDPDPDALALTVGGRRFTAAELVTEARAEAGGLGLAAGGRLMSTRGYDTWPGLAAGLYAPLAAGGSVVLCRHSDVLDQAARTRRAESEHATHFAD